MTTEAVGSGDSQNTGAAPGAETTNGTSEKQQGQSSDDGDVKAELTAALLSISKLETNNKRLSDEDAKRRQASDKKAAEHQEEMAKAGNFEAVALGKDVEIGKLQAQIVELEKFRPKAEAHDALVTDTEAQLAKDMKRLDKEDREMLEAMPDPFKRARFAQRMLSKKSEGTAGDLKTAAAGTTAATGKSYDEMSEEEKTQYLRSL